jgi:hypothetical protein
VRQTLATNVKNEYLILRAISLSVQTFASNVNHCCLFGENSSRMLFDMFIGFKQQDVISSHEASHLGFDY